MFKLLFSAPAGCLQYYTDLSGTVQSFNYGATISGSVVDIGNNMTRPGTRQLANQNYGICVQMQPGYCSIQWSQSGDSLNSFTVSGNTTDEIVLNGVLSGTVGENCTTDFVVIPNPTYVNGTAAEGDRFCGNMLPTVTSEFGLLLIVFAVFKWSFCSVVETFRADCCYR